MKTPYEDQETIIRWYQNEEMATIYTSSYSMMIRFDKCVESGDWELVKTDTCKGDIVSKTYKAPKELLYGRRMKKKSPELTDEQKAELAKRFKR